MKALQFDRTGDLAALKLVDMPDPLPAADEVRVEIRAAGLNPSDVKNVLGRFPIPPCPGYRAATSPGWWWRTEGPARPGGLGHRAGARILPRRQPRAVPDPAGRRRRAQAGKPELRPGRQLRVPYSTAWDALQRSQVKAGTRLLVIGANGAVGKAALALAKALGAEAIGAVRREEQRQALEAQGIAALLLGEPAELAAQVEGIFPAVPR